MSGVSPSAGIESSDVCIILLFPEAIGVVFAFLTPN